MSDENGNNGDDKTPDNVIPFPSRPKHISELLPELIDFAKKHSLKIGTV